MAAGTSTGIDWPAWVQAVGSVAAILAVVWIERGSVRRDRAEKGEAKQSAINERRLAVERCADCLSAILSELDDWDQAHAWEMPRYLKIDLEISREAVRYFLRNATIELGALTVLTLAHAETTMNAAMEEISASLPVTDDRRRVAVRNCATFHLAGFMLLLDNFSNIQGESSRGGSPA